jgi:hypothetical protein
MPFHFLLIDTRLGPEASSVINHKDNVASLLFTMSTSRTLRARVAKSVCKWYACGAKSGLVTACARIAAEAWEKPLRHKAFTECEVPSHRRSEAACPIV